MEEWIIHWGQPIASGIFDHQIDPQLLLELLSLYPFISQEVQVFQKDGLIYQQINGLSQGWFNTIDQINTVAIPQTLTYHRKMRPEVLPLQSTNQYYTENMTRYSYQLSHNLQIIIEHCDHITLQVICAEPLFVTLLVTDWVSLCHDRPIIDQLKVIIQRLT